MPTTSPIESAGVHSLLTSVATVHDLQVAELRNWAAQFQTHVSWILTAATDPDNYEKTEHDHGPWDDVYKRSKVLHDLAEVVQRFSACTKSTSPLIGEMRDLLRALDATYGGTE